MTPRNIHHGANTAQEHAVGVPLYISPSATSLRRRLVVTNSVSLCVSTLITILVWTMRTVGPVGLAPPMKLTNSLPPLRSLQEGACSPLCECPIQNCNTGGLDKFFRSYMNLDFIGNPYDVTQEEINYLETQFKTSYNELGARVCREIIEVKVQESIYDTPRKLQFGVRGRDSTAFSFRYRIEWQCNLCDSGARLFGNDAIDRRNLQATIPPGFSVEDGGADLELFLSNYIAEIDGLVSSGILVSIDEVVKVTELEEQEECEQVADIVSINIVLDFAGNILDDSAEAMALFENAFIQTYNQLNALNIATCDPLFREVGLASGDLSGDDQIFFEITFRCRGCELGDGIFSESSDGERDLGVLLRQTGRSMQTVEADCLCDPSAEELRAPTLAEFRALYLDAIQMFIAPKDDDSGGFVSDDNIDAPVIITTDKSSYFHGETVLVTHVSANPFGMDIISFFPASETNYLMPSVADVAYFTSQGGALTSARIPFPDTGSFKLVVNDGVTEDVVAISNSFDILPSIATLTVDRGSYAQGEEAIAVFGNPEQLGTADKDVILMFSEWETDFDTGDAAYAQFVNQSGSTAVGIPEFINPGFYRFVVRVFGEQSDVTLAVSELFQIYEFI